MGTEMTETPVKFKIDVTATDATALIAALHKAIERLSQNEVHLDATFLVDPVGRFRIQLTDRAAATSVANQPRGNRGIDKTGFRVVQWF